MIVFSDGPPTGAATLAALQYFSVDFRQELVSSGLFDVNVITPTHGFLLRLKLHGINNFQSLVYSYGPFAACIGMNAVPSSADMEDFIVSTLSPPVAGADFTWNSSATAAHARAHKQRLAVRFARIVHVAIRRQGVDTGASPEDSEEPLQSATRKSCDAAYVMAYGEQIMPSMLVTATMLGRLFRAFSGTWISIPLSSIVSQDEARGAPPKAYVLDASRSEWKAKHLSKQIKSPADFLERLWLLLTSIYFLAASVPAPAGDWSGQANHGVVHGVRRQFSRSGASFYHKFWSDRAHEFRESVDTMVRLEYEMRLLWVDSYRENIQLETCARNSVFQNTGVVSAALEYIRSHKKRIREEREANPRGHNKTQGGPPKHDGQPPGGRPESAKEKYDRMAKLPGFKDGLRTFQGELDGGGRICKPFNDNRDGVGCTYGANCKYKHICDVLVAGGKPCGLPHNRLQHP